MIAQLPPPPDLLRRFTPTPYVFELATDNNLIRIEADDLEIALAVRRAAKLQHKRKTLAIQSWRMVRDHDAPRLGADLSVFSTQKLRTLLHRSGTLLVADLETRSVFGFIGAGISARQLTEELLPLLTR